MLNNELTAAESKLSIVIPAKNESRSLEVLLPDIKERFPDAEIIIVDDGSEDDTGVLCQRLGVTTVRHAYSKGNGAAIKSGARAAQGEFIVFMDADGQHRPQDIDHLLARLNEGADMVVGARIADGTQAGFHRAMANRVYNSFASWMTGHQIKDLTSGFRVVRARLFKRFLYLLPNGFSYPTTSTMAFFRSGYSVAYEPIGVQPRMAGSASHIRLWRDGVRFLLIIFKIGALYSPLKLFFPISLAFFATGLGYYLHTYLSAGRFTNMSALLFITSVLVFLIGLVSEQITTLIYRDTDG